MDSWTDKQIQAMEKSGGNQKLIDFFESKNIPKTMQIATKYNTKQAQYYRDRLSRWLEGRTEPPPDPGRYDPVTGVSEAQGAEPLPGETTDEYNARQARLREAARERMRAKFGDGGMSGLGAAGSVEYSGGSYSPGNDGGGLGGLVSGVGSFFKEKVIDNENLRSTVGSAVSGVGSVAGGALNSLKQSEKFGGAVNAVGGVLGKASEKLGVGQKQPSVQLQSGKSIAEQEREFWDGIYVKPGGQQAPEPEVLTRAATSPPSIMSTAGNAPRKSNGSISSMAARSSVGSFGGSKAKAVASSFDDDWGDFDDDFGASTSKKAEAPTPTPAPEPLKRSSTDPTDSNSGPTTPPKLAATNGTNGVSASKPVVEDKPPAASAPMKIEKPPVMSTAPAPVPKKSPAKLSDPDDFFADFGM
jgi:ADP-ribosylation factor GTPase-activating protein 1